MEFDINTLREVVTLLCFAAFIGIVAWAWSARNSLAFHQAENLPFESD
jgi:cytochrome c oxidase cbb3-type subunit IV